ncbi:MAG: ATP-dependent DNA helicase, partial [Thermodesulfobacteriota bacterium]
DIENLENLLIDIHSGEIDLNTRDLTEPSPLSQQILNARPYAFLDNVPLEERRTHAVQNRRWLDPSEAAELGQLDPQAIKIVRDEAWPEAENADDLHDALVLSGFLTIEEAEYDRWMPYFDELISENRATLFRTEVKGFLVAVERLPQMLSIYKESTLNPEIEIPEKLKERSISREEALVEIIRSRLEALGPVTVPLISESLGISLSEIDQALLKLEGEGFVFRGSFTPGLGELEWCERRLLARINKYTLTKLRREIEPVPASDFMRFLFSWQGVSSDEQPEGVEALRRVLDQLEGFEAQAAAWEGDIFSSRLKNYDHTWMDTLCLSGSAVWGRFRIGNTNGGKKSSPIKTTPITIVKRTNLDIWKNIGRVSENNLDDLSNSAKKVFDFISSKGASFFEEIISGSKCLRTETEMSLAELVAKGLITSDSYTGLRALLVRSKYKTERGRRRKRLNFNMEGAGRWSLIRNTEDENKDKKLSKEMRAIARIFLNRYGVVFRKLLERESLAPPWRDLVRALRLLELRGDVRGGRFVEGVTGEQFALPEAVASLRDMRRRKKSGQLVSLSASDPLNLMGIITPGKKVAAHYKNRVLYRDGVPAAFKEGAEIRLLSEFDNGEEWSIKQTLIKRNFSPKLKPYLGKGAA